MANVDQKVHIFRSKYERDLRRLVTQGCAMASCAYEGNSEIEENEMNSFAAGVLNLVERAKRKPRRPAVETEQDSKVTPIRA